MGKEGGGAEREREATAGSQKREAGRIEEESRRRKGGEQRRKRDGKRGMQGFRLVMLGMDGENDEKGGVCAGVISPPSRGY